MGMLRLVMYSLVIYSYFCWIYKLVVFLVALWSRGCTGPLHKLNSFSLHILHWYTSYFCIRCSRDTQHFVYLHFVRWTCQHVSDDIPVHFHTDYLLNAMLVKEAWSKIHLVIAISANRIGTTTYFHTSPFIKLSSEPFQRVFPAFDLFEVG